MKLDELKEFISREFKFILIEENERENVLLYRIDLRALFDFAKTKLNEDLGDFERETFEKNIQKFENAEDKTPIFAILHKGEYPVQFEVKTGVALAKILREKESVVPSKLMDEREWSKIIGFGQISKMEAEDILRLSYRLASE